jgi:hypothetical protein
MMSRLPIVDPVPGPEPRFALGCRNGLLLVGVFYVAAVLLWIWW